MDIRNQIENESEGKKSKFEIRLYFLAYNAVRSNNSIILKQKVKS